MTRETRVGGEESFEMFLGNTLRAACLYVFRALACLDLHIPKSQLCWYTLISPALRSKSIPLCGGYYSHFLVDYLDVGNLTRVIDLLSLNYLIGSYVEKKTE